MNKDAQKKAPFADALEEYCRQRMVPFHTPGHKLGAGAPVREQILFGKALRQDLGLMYALDDLFQPEGPLREAMELAADAYGAGRTFFSVNGTTACIEAMILAVCGPGDTVLIPREAHRSVLSGLILSGAVPAYMESRYAEREEVSLGPDPASLQAAIAAHKDARAVLFTYPTYDGLAGQLTEMVRIAHQYGLIVLVDEAHGAHLAFHEELPPDALACGADCVAQSTHKLTGSLTQTSMLHCRRGFPYTDRVAAAMALVQSTSPHYWFLASLDLARQQMALEGRQRETQALSLARQARKQLNALPGISCFGREMMRYEAVGNLDETKLTIDFSGLGLMGREAERLLRDARIEVELTAGHHVLALVTFGDSDKSIQALLDGCRKIAGMHQVVERKDTPEPPLPQPQVVMAPREAWYAEKETISRSLCAGRICAEMITFYPPGIPVVAAGEVLTGDVLAYIDQKLAAGYVTNGAADSSLDTIQVVRKG